MNILGDAEIKKIELQFEKTGNKSELEKSLIKLKKEQHSCLHALENLKKEYSKLRKLLGDLKNSKIIRISKFDEFYYKCKKIDELKKKFNLKFPHSMISTETLIKPNEKSPIKEFINNLNKDTNYLSEYEEYLLEGKEKYYDAQKNFLETKLRLAATNINIVTEYLQKSITPQPEENKNGHQINTSGKTIKQIALKHIYEGKPITRNNGDEIAIKNGFISGEKLFQEYTKFRSRANRIGRPVPCTPKKLKNKIELFQKVINMLPESKRQQAIDEVTILENIYNNEIT